MKVWFSPYALRSASTLNRLLAGQTQHGACLRFEFGDAVGHSTCHPWPILGDAPLDRQLALLAAAAAAAPREDMSPSAQLPILLQKSWYFARLDAEARARRRSLFANEGAAPLAPPESHFLVTDVAALSAECVEACVEEGFRAFKVKIGRDPAAECASLNRLAACWHRDARLRLDANGGFDSEGLAAFLGGLAAPLRARVEFIEDPVGSDSVDWRTLRFGAPFARDRCTGHGARGYDFLVIKPAVQDVVAELVRESPAVRLVVTSYLDHPLGQACAAYEAARLAEAYPTRVVRCGLLSHRAYETNAFAELLAKRGPAFTPPPGLGLGFDELLEGLPWTRLR